MITGKLLDIEIRMLKEAGYRYGLFIERLKEVSHEKGCDPFL